MLSAENPAIWGSQEKLQSLQREKSFLEKIIAEYEGFHQRLLDARILLDMALEAHDETTFAEVKTEVNALLKLGGDLEIKRILNGELDSNSAYLSINSGAGGTEACDWASMLMRMYMRYADQHGYRVEGLEQSDGDGAGIKSVTLLIEGPYAYGYLKSESGVHRLVRISPFDANARRHTSFASVYVWPEVDESIRIEINPSDIEVQTYRSSGAGGQHVNKTDSAVRMKHLPTGIVVACQLERSQIQNRAKALKMLKAALYEKELEKRREKEMQDEDSKLANEWGSQIRSYILHPYQMVKDHRTDFETSQSREVLDGDLDEFIMAYLKTVAASRTMGVLAGKGS